MSNAFADSARTTSTTNAEVVNATLVIALAVAVNIGSIATTAGTALL